MSRMRKALLAGGAILIGLPVALTGVVLVAGNLPIMRQALEARLPALSGGSVAVHGISGVFPTSLRASRIELTDAGGAYGEIDDAAIDLSLLPLLGGELRIDRLRAARIAISRPPRPAAPSAATPASGPFGFALPLRVTLGALNLPRIDLGPALAGADLHLALRADASLRSDRDAALHVALDDRDGGARARLSAVARAAGDQVSLSLSDPADGLLTRLSRNPALAPLNIEARLEGPRDAGALSLTARIGALHADVQGTLDLLAQTLDLRLGVASTAFSPAPGTALQGVSVNATATGPFAMPSAHLTASLSGVEAAGNRLDALQAVLTMAEGRAQGRLTLSGIKPAQGGDPFGPAPLPIELDARFGAAPLAADLRIADPRLQLTLHATQAPQAAANFALRVPDIAPFAAIGGVAVSGGLTLDGDATRDAAGAFRGQLRGDADLASPSAPIAQLLGRARLAASFDGHAGTDQSGASQERAAFPLDHAQIDVTAAKLNLQATAHNDRGKLAAAAQVSLADLSALSAGLRGALRADVQANGTPADLQARARITGTAGSSATGTGPLDLTLEAKGLPAAPEATLAGNVTLDGAQLNLLAKAAQSAEGLHVELPSLRWKSLNATADLRQAKGALLPLGNFRLQAATLDDASRLAGMKLGGNLDLNGKLAAGPRGATLNATLAARGLAAAAQRIATLNLTANATALPTEPNVDIKLDADGIAAQGWHGGINATARGPLAAIAVQIAAALSDAQARALSVQSRATVNARGQSAALSLLDANYAGSTLHLIQPASFQFGPVMSVSVLRLRTGEARLSADGQISPKLALTASIAALSPALFKPFAPDFAGAGTLSAEAKLAGTLAQPSGRIHLHAAGLHLDHGPARQLPPLTSEATLVLAPSSATIDATLDGGAQLALSAHGTAPLDARGKLALALRGHADLALANPILAGSGQRAAGRLVLDTSLSGSAKAPQARGTLRLSGGTIEDYAQGVHLRDIDALITLAGDRVDITHLNARAGRGTVRVSGHLGLDPAELPLDLSIASRKATLLNSDIVTATISSDLTVSGRAARHLAASGRVVIDAAEITVPNGLPPGVAKIAIRRPGDAPAPANPAPPLPIDLAIVLDAPNNIFIRGHGLDAEMGGNLTVGGRAAKPDIAGGFKLRRGVFSLAGTTLKFSKGNVGFDGISATGKLDPTLDFAADSTQGGVTATLNVQGYASNPKLSLSSVPDLPQDEVLAHLLFGQSMKDLTPLQIGQIGIAFAELSGITSSEGPLGSLRKGLGLDRLSVGGGEGGAGASVEAGRYVMKDVYVGAKQDTSGGGGTRVQVLVDLTERLKARAEIAAGGGSAQGSSAQGSEGTTLGISYGFEY